jgi:hypothetical protein
VIGGQARLDHSVSIIEPAWRAKPSWYLLTTEDRMIPPDAHSLEYDDLMWRCKHYFTINSIIKML